MRNLCHVFEDGGEVIQCFCERGVGFDERFVVLEYGCELVVEVLLAFLGIFEFPAEPFVLLAEGDSDEVDGFIASVFEIAFRDVDVAVYA